MVMGKSSEEKQNESDYELQMKLLVLLANGERKSEFFLL